MKLLTLNFLTCARKACKTSAASFPLHPRDAELEQIEVDLNPLLIQNVLPRVEWDALKSLSSELGLPNLPDQCPDAAELTSDDEPSQTLKDLHTLLLETTIQSGKLVCGNCGHEYAIKEGIANFLLPSHLV
ncbi:Multifunctional methyltransferase subunit trm112 [Cryomyces minteri]|uniref:Multifunctional methyltransferase subunit trm112 n=1 Tax=Cryomyces minteri TaxID=331657 RepID=A0A4U0XVG9_9PEZI|nr:Multifunctional methyltransferase subunit trm112 [Cryomyces minteri]TKA79808.1 Multifunctional methyltransferase subunit trm112 [Cryomyces minteri]